LKELDRERPLCLNPSIPEKDLMGLR